MKRVVLSLIQRMVLLLLLLALAAPAALALTDADTKPEYQAWYERVYQNLNLDWQSTEIILGSGERTIVDDFADGSLAPMWLSYADSGVTVEEVNGTGKISGYAPYVYGSSYNGGSIILKDAQPVKTFTATLDIFAKSGAFGDSRHRGEHFGFFASGSNGHYVGIQYWADAYRISWDDGTGWNRIYASSNGDETSKWYTWKICYDAQTKQAKVFVGGRQIGTTVTVDLGATFRISDSLSAFAGTWLEEYFDNFVLTFPSEDTAPPDLILDVIDPQIIWPPNGKLVDVVVSGTAADSGSGLAAVTVETEDEYGQFQPVRDGFGPIQLEAYRKGDDLDGRTYTVKVTATDKANNSTIKYMHVVVPHDIGVK